MSSSDYNISKVITDRQDDILGVRIIENVRVAATYAESKVPLPNEERFTPMFAQSEIFVNIANSQVDFFGRFRYVVCSFEDSNIVFLPFTSGSGGRSGYRSSG